MNYYKILLSEFKSNFEKGGFELYNNSVSDNLMIFKKNKFIIYFFYNTIYPTTKNLKLETLLIDNDSIYVSGYNPIIDIKNLPKLETLFVSDNTYLLPTDNTNDIISFLYNNYIPKLKYVLVDRIFIDELIYCKNILDCHHKSLESKQYIEYMMYVKNIDEEEYLKMDRVILPLSE